MNQSCENIGGASKSLDNNPSTSRSSLEKLSAVPPLCHLDFGVIENLPAELFAELNEIYGGELIDFVKNKGNGKSTSTALFREDVEGEFSLPGNYIADISSA